MTSASVRRLDTSDRRQAAARLGCQTLVVVPALSSESTGHVDLLVHFLQPDVVGVASLESDSATDVDSVRLDVAAERLRRAASELGRRLEIVRVPSYRSPDGQFFSYLNVLPLENRLLVPSFEAVPTDVQADAYGALRRASGKALVPIPADAIALAGGGLHCVVLGLHLPDRAPVSISTPGAGPSPLRDGPG